VTSASHDVAARPVLHFMADWLPNSEVFIYDLITHLQHPSTVLAGNPLVNTDRFALGDLHSLHPLYRIVRVQALRPRAIDFAISRLIRRRGIGLVHVHHGYQLEVVAPTASRLGLPIVLSLHGHDVTGYLEERPDAYAPFRHVISSVVVPSRFLAEHAAAAGFAPEKVVVLPSGIDTSLFAPTPLPEGPPVVLFVGRFVEKKGIDVLAEAWPLVQQRHPEAALRLFGYGPLEGLARSIQGNVEIVDAPSKETVAAGMREARAIVSPSHRAPDDALESLLMVNLEAQASGRPVVTTRHGAIPEYVRQDETALLVDEFDADGLADALSRVIGDTALATRLGAAGPAWAGNFDVHRTAAAMDHLYDERLTISSTRPEPPG
jgi:colanic acid/amylovoran biosynthesis glycosyltransferase